MTPHYRAVVDIESGYAINAPGFGRIMLSLVFVAPKHKHTPPFAKRPEGHRRRAVRKFVRRNKEAWLHAAA